MRPFTFSLSANGCLFVLSLVPSLQADSLTIEGDLEIQAVEDAAAGAIKAAGTIESTSGGFKLPDGTVIHSAADLGNASALLDSAGNPVIQVAEDGTVNLTQSLQLADGTVLSSAEDLEPNYNKLNQHLLDLENSLQIHPKQGNIAWAKSFGGTEADNLYSTRQLNDDSLLIHGYYRATMQLDVNTSLTSLGNRDGFLASYDQDGKLAWAKSFGGTEVDDTNSTIQLNDDQLLVTGYYSGTMLLENGINLTSAGNKDGFLASVSKDGQLLWAKSFGGSEADETNSSIRLSDDQLLVTGYYRGTMLLENGINLTSAGDKDGFIANYDQDGNLEWAKSFGGTKADDIYSTRQLNDGSLLVRGYYRGTMQLDTDNSLTSAGDKDGFLASYDQDGNLKWAISFGGTEAGDIYSTRQLNDGSLLVHGYYRGTMQLEDTSLTSAGHKDGFIARYSADDGKLIWAKSFGGTEADAINSTHQLNDGSLLVTGEYHGTMQLEGTILTSAGDKDGFIANYSVEQGNLKWAISFGGPSSDSISSTIQLNDGSLLVRGRYQGTMQLDANTSLTSAGSSDGFLASYSAGEGQMIWAISVGGIGADAINSTHQLDNGSLLVTGYYRDTMQLDANTSLTSAGSTDGFVISYSPHGQFLWANSFGGTETDYTPSVSELNDGSLLVLGRYKNTMQLDSTTSLTSAGSSDGFLVDLQPQSGVSLGSHALTGPQTIFSVGNGTADAPNNALTILDSGNVGIGTDSPSSALQVVGTLTADALQLPDGTVISSSADFGQGPAGPQGPQGIPGPAGPAGASPFSLQGSNAVFTSGKVGIGTDNPNAELEVAGNTEITGDLAVQGTLILNAQGDLSMGAFNTGE